MSPQFCPVRLVYAVCPFFEKLRSRLRGSLLFFWFWKTSFPSARFVTYFENFRLVYAVSTFSKPLAHLFQNHASRLHGLPLFQQIVSRLRGLTLFQQTSVSPTRFNTFFINTNSRLVYTVFDFLQTTCKNQWSINIFPSGKPLENRRKP